MKAVVISSICQMFHFTVSYSSVLIIFLLINDSLFAVNLVHLPCLFFSLLSIAIRIIDDTSCINFSLLHLHSYLSKCFCSSLRDVLFSELSLSHIISPNFVRFCVCAYVCACSSQCVGSFAALRCNPTFSQLLNYSIAFQGVHSHFQFACSFPRFSRFPSPTSTAISFDFRFATLSFYLSIYISFYLSLSCLPLAAQ